MFSKIDKKILVILIIVIAVILFVGIGIYKYMPRNPVKVQNMSGGAQTEQNESAVNDPKTQTYAQGNQAQGDIGGGILSICVSKCGDGVCQKTDPNCGKNNNLNCICLETTQNCPGDCK